jgi:hypothetical protein
MEKTNEATPRPWYIDFEYWPRLILGSTDKQVADCEYIKDAELIVKAVNAYDSLVEENKDLHAENGILKSYEDENQKLREALEERLKTRKDELDRFIHDFKESNTYAGTIQNEISFLKSLLTKAKNV